MLNKEEYKRYNRHLILDQVGIQGQLKLKAARVLVIGAGGLGCPILQYLSAAGVGIIGIVDFDRVDVSNLQRQVLFNEADIGKNKAESAARHLIKLNPEIEFQVFPVRLSASNALDIFNDFDIVVDGSDNFETRYLVNDAALVSNMPLVYGSIYKFQGQLSVFNYNQGPTYRCLFPTPPMAGSIENCSEIGVIGVLPGIIGTQQANEAIKIILGIGEPLSGKLLIYDALKATYTSIGFSKSKKEIQQVIDRKNEFSDFDYTLFCGIDEHVSAFEIESDELNTYLNQDTVRIIDIREAWEEPQLHGSNVERIIMSDFLMKIDRFKTNKKVVLICQTGTRSNKLRTLLKEQYQLTKIIELKGGMENYGND